MKFRTCLLAIVVVMLFANVAWAIGAITFVDGDQSVHYTDSAAFQDALDEVDDSLGLNEIDSIYVYGGGDTDYFAASGSHFDVDENVDGLFILFDNSPTCTTSIWISGDNVHLYGRIYIDTDDYFGMRIWTTANNTTIDGPDIEAGSWGIMNYGSNTDMLRLQVHDCELGGIHSDAVNASIDNVIISNCGAYGIKGDGFGNSTEITKALISDCYYGCYFFANIRVNIDQTTIYDFTEDGIYNASNADSVHCKRCLVYNGDYDDGDFCYYNITFDSSAAYSVAMGDSCSSHGDDESGCDNTEFLKSSDKMARAFDTLTADIYVDTLYPSIAYYYLRPEHAAKLLSCYTIPHGLYDTVYYVENVGYDTDIDRYEIEKKHIETLSKPNKLVTINAYPNPFNSAIQIDAQEDTEIAIYDLSGQKVADIPSNSNAWKPERNIGSGIYLVRVVNMDGKVGTKNIVYLK